MNLIDTTILYAGTTSCAFRAQKKGQVIPIVGTITNQVTIVDGVISVINETGATSLGYETESNTEFRLRREQSVALKSGNNADRIKAEILTLEGVIDCEVWSNNTNSTDDTGTQAHTIWVVVEGGANTDIAEIIYSNIAGAGMRGTQTVNIVTASEQPITIKFDRPTIKNLYIKFDVQKIEGSADLNINGIKQYITNNLQYLIGEDAETSKVTAVCANAMTDDGGNGYALNVLISDNSLLSN